MAWFKCSGGSDVDTVLSDGQVSTLSAYVTATFDDVSGYKWLCVQFTADIFEIYTIIPVSVIPADGYYDFWLPVAEPVRGINARITRTSVTLTSYSGSWREIFCSIEGVKKDMFA